MIFFVFLRFSRLRQSKTHTNTVIPFMRQLRILGQNVWYEIRSRINNREPLFCRSNALALFSKVFRETGLRFVFEVHGLRLEDDWLTFYIKPEDGFELPEIMKWMKQVFAQRYNRLEGRIGHIWGDRYWSRILEGEPDVEGAVEPAPGDRPCWGGKQGKAGFSLVFPFPAALSPG
jgi:REP element-mobilizing transposase RayT